MRDEQSSNSESAVLLPDYFAPSECAGESTLAAKTPRTERVGSAIDTASMDASNRWQRLLEMVRRRQVFGETVFVSFAIVGLQLLQGILLARLLGPVGRGEYATAVLYPQMLMFIGLLGGIEVLARRAATASNNRRALRNAAIRLALFTGTLTTLVAIVFALVALPADKRYLLPYCVSAAFGCLGLHLHLMLTAVDRGQNQFRRFNVRRLIGTAAFPVLLAILLPLLGVNLIITCLAFLLSTGVAAACCFCGEAPSQSAANSPSLGKLLQEGRPYAILMLVNDLFERVDLVLILWIAPLEIQGFYAAMLPAVYPLTIAPNTLGMFLFNAAARAQNELTAKRLIQILAVTFGFQALLTVAFLFLISPAIRILYGTEFLPAVVFAYWLAPAAALKGIAQGLDGYLKGRGRPAAAIGGRIAALFLMLTLVAVLYPRYSVMSLPMGACGGQIACVGWLIMNVLTDIRRKK